MLLVTFKIRAILLPACLQRLLVGIGLNRHSPDAGGFDVIRPRLAPWLHPTSPGEPPLLGSTVLPEGVSVNRRTPPKATRTGSCVSPVGPPSRTRQAAAMPLILLAKLAQNISCRPPHLGNEGRDEKRAW